MRKTQQYTLYAAPLIGVVLGVALAGCKPADTQGAPVDKAASTAAATAVAPAEASSAAPAPATPGKASPQSAPPEPDVEEHAPRLPPAAAPDQFVPGGGGGGQCERPGHHQWGCGGWGDHDRDQLDEPKPPQVPDPPLVKEPDPDVFPAP